MTTTQVYKSHAKKLGRYYVLQMIGKGGTSRVFRAYDPDQDRYVAIKILSPNIGIDSNNGNRFKREIDVVMGLNHPNIVPIYDFGEINGFTYLVMPMLEGGSLADRLRVGTLTPDEGANMVDQISHALQYAHEQGIVHRDVKPGNILFDNDGNAMLTDFGLARVNDSSISLTGSNVIGTPAYISPEQARGEEIDERSDQYSLGVILYQLVTEKLPFDAETPIGVLIKHIREPLPAPSLSKPNLPDIVERVIQKATAKEPEHRFDSILEFNYAFQNALAHAMNPDSVPAPEIGLIEEEFETLLLEPDTFEPPRKVNKWVKTGIIAGVVAIVMLACPVSSKALIAFLEGFSNSAVGGVAIDTLNSDHLTVTALMATNQVLMTELVSDDGDPLYMSKGQTATAIAETLTAVPTYEPTEDPAGSPTPTADIDASETSAEDGMGEDEDTPEPGDTEVPTTGPGGGATTTASFTPAPSSTPMAEESHTPTMEISPTEVTGIPPETTGTAVPLDTPTPANTSTEDPATETPSPTYTAIPPTPTTDPCTLLILNNFTRNGQEIGWNLVNNSSESMLLTKIHLNWPSGNDELSVVKFGSPSIWDQGTTDIPTIINSGWTGESRVIGASGTKTITFLFIRNAKNNGYVLILTFDNNPSCTVQVTR